MGGLGAWGLGALSLAGLGALGLWLRPPPVAPAPAPRTLAVVSPPTAPAPAPAAGVPAADAPDVALERALAAGEKVDAACGGVLAEEACALARAHPAWGLEAARRVAAGHVVLGLTAEQVKAAWDEPVSQREEADGRTAWCYDEDCASGFVLKDGRVVGLKE
ncbi:MAG: hypothetical protein R3F60_27795 [bacterium]